MTTPMENIINRSLRVDQAKELTRIANGIDEAINFGSHILALGLKNGGTEIDLPALLFLRNLLENIDAIAVLIRHGIVDPCNSLLRTALENLFSLEYLLVEENKSTERSRSFLVWNFVVHQKWLTKADLEGKVYQEMEAKFKKDRLMEHAFPYFIDPDTGAREMAEKIFELPNYKAVKEEYDRTHKIRKNPAWYSLYNGPATLEQVANVVSLPALYEVLYRGWSPTTHGTNILQGKVGIDEKGFAEILPLRDASAAASIAQHCMNICILSFRRFIDIKLPENKKEYNDWYLQVREFNLSLVPHPSSQKEEL